MYAAIPAPPAMSAALPQVVFSAPLDGWINSFLFIASSSAFGEEKKIYARFQSVMKMAKKKKVTAIRKETVGVLFAVWFEKCEACRLGFFFFTFHPHTAQGWKSVLLFLNENRVFFIITWLQDLGLCWSNAACQQPPAQGPSGFSPAGSKEQSLSPSV